MIRAVTYPMAFAGGWIFNFVVDVKFVSGFLLGWLAHSKLAPVVEWFLGFFQ